MSLIVSSIDCNKNLSAYVYTFTQAFPFEYVYTFAYIYIYIYIQDETASLITVRSSIDYNKTLYT
jgi:hypothetical protein